METTAKTRTPSRCREWERQRRNKFNDAITRLGEAVRDLNKANDSSEKDTENVQLPKIEIVQKAIVCLTNYAHEKTQLKAEILALQVKIEAASVNKTPTRKDASTQAHISFIKKTQYEKYLKLLMLKKSKRNAIKEKSVHTTNITVESKAKNQNQKSKPTVNSVTSPKILPKCDMIGKKGTENTIVVLPAAPYLFPQRPLFLPAVPPAFVIVDPNMQSLNKTSVPIVNRTGGDTTKTTMVNILPISAYSRPLSATKAKRTNMKLKCNTQKKNKKKSTSIVEESAVSDTEISKTRQSLKVHKKDNVEIFISDKPKEVLVSNTASKCVTTSPKIIAQTKNDTSARKNKENDEAISENKESIDSSKVMETPNNNTTKNTQNVDINQKPLPPLAQANESEIHKEADICIKPTSEEDKDKENKLPNMLDTALCENGVDGGNARLELAEEFLAASPTAAFLMSFPLVSGNRADSPADDTSNTVQPNIKENAPVQLSIPPPPSTHTYFEKPSASEGKSKTIHKQLPTSSNTSNKQPTQHKYVDTNIISKPAEVKSSSSIPTSNVSSDNPFLSLPMPSTIITTTQPDTFTLDFDCSMSKTIPSQSSSYVTNSNLFYKSDPFNTVKSTIYSTSSIASGHEFNSLGLYPCAMEKYSKNKSEYTNVEDNLMKIGSSRLTYDIDLGWSHKGFDFVSCTTNANTFSKDILTTATAPSYSSTYNPFNPEFHVPLVSSSSKKDTTNKPISSFADTITSFYSAPQPANLWSEEMCFYNNNNNASKTLPNKHQNYLHLDHAQANTSIRPILTKQYDTKPDAGLGNIVKPSNETIRQQIPDKYHKKSPSKMHINWMTSELRPMQNNCNPPQTGMKEPHKQTYVQMEHNPKKQEHNEGNYFPITMHNFPTQLPQEDFQVWPSARPLGTTEISIEPPPINLPTLVGDLALGPHDKKKNADLTNRVGTDIQNCSNFLSVTQLMNRSSDNATSRYHGSNTETPKSAPAKQSNTPFPNDSNRKTITTRIETNITQPCYVFNDLKPINSYENMGQFSQPKPKANKNDKSTKVHKHSYSAEALMRSGTCTQKVQDHVGSKFMTPSQKYNDFNTAQDTSVAQVSHFPPILDYSDNSFSGQQFSGTTLYNSTTNTISNSFYSNFMSSSANIMSGSYTSAPFTGDFIDYNQAECNYTNNKYEDFKMRSNPTVFQDKVPTNYKSSRRESGAKHKLECSKKESSKKYQNKRAKLSNEVEEWSDTSNLFWQNKGQNKKHPNLISEEFTFTNYVGNQMPPQYQHELFNSHLVGGVQPGAGADRSLAAFPATSRANFNLSTIFPEITMWSWWWCLLIGLPVSSGEQFTLGYITGSDRQANDRKYSRPGRVISGAISMAVEEVNKDLLGPMNHSLHFVVAETYGQEEESIRQVAALWAANVSAFIGPQETCVHEGRMAAAFNLPMISYYCRDVASSNKQKYATFARTRPSDTDISRAVVAVLTHYNFMHVSIVYLNAPNNDFSRLANAIIAAAREKQISVLRIESYQDSHHFINEELENLTRNPFLDIVRETYKDTRIYVSVGYYHDHIGLMMALEAMQLLDSGEYAAIGVDVEKYNPDQAVTYLSGPLRKEPLPARAFRSYLAVAPSPAPSYSNFAAEVNKRLTEPPFNFNNPLLQVSSNGGKVIPVEAAWLHDAVWVYARALAAALRAGESPRDGRALVARIRNSTYRSVMGYTIHMDESGEAEGNYTLLSMDPERPPGLYPLAVLHRSAPELRFKREMNWPGGRVPLSEPPCGFRNEKCASHVGVWTLSAAGGALALLVLAALALYRGWRYEQELDSLLWKIDFRDLQLPDKEQRASKLNSNATGNGNAMVIVSGNPEKNSGNCAGGVRSSQVSLSSNPDLDFRYSAIFTEVALYRGRLLSVKRIRRHHIDITREIKKELKIMRDLQHDNVNGFVGACIEPPNVCALSEYCTRGSLKDILENDDIKLDNMFIASLVGDIIRGMIFIHESPLQYHGSLRPSNCLVDARWVVKLAGFGLRAFRAGELPPTEPNDIRSHIDSLVYLAPELLRAAGWGAAAAAQPCEGSPAADVYAFALVLYEMHTRRGPFGADAPPGPALLRRLANPHPIPYRPPVDVLTAQFDCSRECCVECWAEEPTLRPDFKAIRTRLRPLRKGMKPNIFDNMIAMMEKYANNLEVLVDERTDQLQEEKKKTEALLEEMLPVPVAEQLKRGHRVMPESYDSVTIYFSDIVGFTAMSAESTPLQVVDFLNDLYTCFDSILENFDVYKVETIGDAYMVVSGLPIRNGIMHAGEVASMALALLSATQSFRVRHRPNQRLLLRVGIHSALKIHCSSTCKGLLDKLGGYILEERGIVAMKGKRDQVTYWLKGEKKETAAARAHRRAQAEGASQLAAERRGQRSSLKNKSWKNQIGVLHRCCSLESPKKLRFASGNLLESHTDSVLHHRSDEYLMEVIGDSRLPPAQRGDLLESPSLRHEQTSVSCPIIEHTETSPAPITASSCATLPHDHKRAKACDIKLVVNGCSYNENEAGIPLLADA